MSVIYDLEHITTYHYRRQVTFGEHRAIFLPSAGHGERIISYSVEANIAAKTRWTMAVSYTHLTLPTKRIV